VPCNNNLNCTKNNFYIEKQAHFADVHQIGRYLATETNFVAYIAYFGLRHSGDTWAHRVSITISGISST